VIEDAGHAFGARYDGAPIGSHSDFVGFSFHGRSRSSSMPWRRRSAVDAVRSAARPRARLGWRSDQAERAPIHGVTNLIAWNEKPTKSEWEPIGAPFVARAECVAGILDHRMPLARATSPIARSSHGSPPSAPP